MDAKKWSLQVIGLGVRQSERQPPGASPACELGNCDVTDLASRFLVNYLLAARRRARRLDCAWPMCHLDACVSLGFRGANSSFCSPAPERALDGREINAALHGVVHEEVTT